MPYALRPSIFLGSINKRIPFSQKTPLTQFPRRGRILRKSNPWRHLEKKSRHNSFINNPFLWNRKNADCITPGRHAKSRFCSFQKIDNAFKMLPSLVINGGMIMLSNSQVILELPEEKDNAMPSNPGFVKTIRY